MMTHPNESRVERRPHSGDPQKRKHTVTVNGVPFIKDEFSPNALARVLRDRAKKRKAAAAGDDIETRKRSMKARLQKAERAALTRIDPVES